jgi:uncharacterized protein YjdB
MRSLLLLLLLLLTACGGGGGGNSTSTATLTSIAVAPGNPTTPAGVPTQFKAVGTYSDGTSKDITSTVAWSSGTPSVATVVGTSGLASAVAAGSSTITASSGSIAGNTTLTVTLGVLQSIAVTPANPSIAVPQTAKFTATGTYSDGTSHDVTLAVTWSSATSAVASIGTSGTATAISAGTSVITAKQNLISGSTTLTVTPAVLLTNVVTPANPSIAVPQSIQLTATGNYSDGTSRDLSTFVTWSSANGGVASITGNGVAAALAPGATLVTATMGSIAGATTVTVNPAVLQSIALTPANPSVLVGHSQQFTATGSYSDGTFRDISASVAWSSGTTAVATVNGAGLASGVSAGAANVTAALGAISASTTLTVTAPVLQSVAVTPSNPSILVSGTQQFTATGTYSDGSNHDLSSSAIWSSGTASVATVSNAGLASGVSAGSSTITAKSGTISGSTTLTVAAPVTDAVTPGNVTLGSAGSCTGGKLTTTFHVAAANNITWTAAGDPNTPPLGGTPLGIAPGSGSGAGNVVVTITVPPQLPSSSFSSCSLTYTLGTFSNVFVTFSDGTVIGVTVYWTFVGTT